MTDRLLAIDIGTQSARAAVFTVDGQILGIAQISHDVDRPHPSWAQQQPERWWEETCQAIRHVLQETARAGRGDCRDRLVRPNARTGRHRRRGERHDALGPVVVRQTLSSASRSGAVAARRDRTGRRSPAAPLNPAWTGLEGPLAQGQRAGCLSPRTLVSGPQGFHQLSPDRRGGRRPERSVRIVPVGLPTGRLLAAAGRCGRRRSGKVRRPCTARTT